ncbi:MAG: ABC transporter substrate-binding protein [Candidatus Tectomicrobia bacterium]|nr:ABC transporter substrate-binding protein [Candidatus Tectomicrobia bacterium]
MRTFCSCVATFRVQRLVLFLLLTLLLLGPALRAPAAAAPLEIRLGSSTIVPLIFLGLMYNEPINRDLLRHYGKSYTVNEKPIDQTPIQVQALAAKEIDLGMLAPVSLANGVVNARLDIKVVADLGQEGIENHAIIRYGVLETSGIKTVRDLKGKVCNIFAFGTATDMVFRAMLHKAGMDTVRDVQTLQGEFATQEAMLREGKVQCAAFVPPFSVLALRRGGIRFLFNTSDAIGPYQTLFLVGRTEELTKHRDAYNDFFEDYVRAWNWYINPANKPAVMAAAAKRMKRPAEAFAWYGGEFDYYRGPNAIPNIEALQRNIDLSAELKFAKGRIEAKKYTDLSFVQRAAGIVAK